MWIMGLLAGAVVPRRDARGVPLRNRVVPTGEIVVDPGRGLMMGNRGCLHGHGRDLGVARWRSKLWICCVLGWKGRVRDPMPPGRYTSLFFTDEACALAAGHRPCAYCRREDYLAFVGAWQGLARRPYAAEIDAVLHRERVESRTRRQVTRPGRVAELPDGVMVRAAGVVGLVIGGRVAPWSFEGYAPPTEVGDAEVLTPPSIVAAIEAGYRPLVHPSVTTMGCRPLAHLSLAAPGCRPLVHMSVAAWPPVPVPSGSR